MQRYLGTVVSAVAALALTGLLMFTWVGMGIPIDVSLLAAVMVGFIFGRLSTYLDRKE